jgi:hypothetical protein
MVTARGTLWRVILEARIVVALLIVAVCVLAGSAALVIQLRRRKARRLRLRGIKVEQQAGARAMERQAA